ncbi:hypothetical protein GQ43DRAFT_48671 [Delitschia confertaspora ATCC 74209]|uniref:Putative gamma-glutamylcyclotransferase n=1 Tax=Delitschia confertaspora ATCC 74209 TaxID=1513339 RepID=A0A9P4JKZ6_9PLEO|nr:hypothetical protein GQ43DRAFT_48671 [Delitschia confertaspora ATCC 74209]
MASQPETHTAFFYGTLMAPPVLYRVISSTATTTTYRPKNPNSPKSNQFTKSNLTTRPALLSGYQRHKVKHADYPAIISAAKSCTVRGTLVSGLSDADIWRLDIFEGSEYQRISVDVEVLGGEREEDVGGVVGGNGVRDLKKGETVKAEVYVWKAGRSRLEDGQWDFNEFVKEKMSRWVGGKKEERDEGFRDVDNAVAALENETQNDPTGGRGQHGNITRVLERENEKAKEVVRSAV